MKILILEDEQVAAKRLQHMLEELEAQAEILALLEGVRQSVDWFKNHEHPDLVFMDIQLADGICFEVFDQVAISCPIIFITAYDQFAIKAFKVNSLDYILKPFNLRDLQFALQKYRKRLEERAPQSKLPIDPSSIQALVSLLKPSYKSRFFVKINHTIHSISNRDIAFFHSSDASTLLTNQQGRNFVVDYTLDDLEKLLNPQDFFRINRQYLVHIDAIAKINTYSKGRIQVNLQYGPENSLLVSRGRTKDFREWLGQ